MSFHDGCTTCTDAAREKNRELDTIRIQAKQKAADEKKAQVICKDEATGFFIADIQTVLSNPTEYLIQEVVSGL